MPLLSQYQIYAATFTPQRACRHIYAAACMQLHSRCSHATSLMQKLSRCSIGAAALMLQPRTQQHFSVAASSSQPHAAAFTPRIYTAASALQHLSCSSRGGALQVKADHLERIFQR